ncbi:MAG: GIY-YIG nuclease family protein [Comamonadaceae bacterium]|nr:MAG: GIY-YIG nuclease family protein [Comamonadaceae bacterium]
MRYGWSLEKEDWTILHQLLSDTKWTRVYLEREYKDSIPNKPGVYIICGKTEAIGFMGEAISKLNNAVYVGQSINLKGRFQDHVAGYGKVKKAKLTFRRLEYWWTELEKGDLSRIEQALVNALGPSANEVNVIKAKVGEPVRI